jgi:hypothetical protein
MSPLRKCHFATRHGERRVRSNCSVPGITSQRPPRPRRLRMLARPPRITPRQPPIPRHPRPPESHRYYAHRRPERRRNSFAISRMPRRPPTRITSRQTPMSRHPLIPSRSCHPTIGAGNSDPSSKEALLGQSARPGKSINIERNAPAGLIRRHRAFCSDHWPFDRAGCRHLPRCCCRGFRGGFALGGAPLANWATGTLHGRRAGSRSLGTLPEQG